MAEHVDGSRFAVRARYANELQCTSRPAVRNRRREWRRAATVANDEGRQPLRQARRLLDDRGDGACLLGHLEEVVSIACRAVHGDEHRSRLHEATVVGDAARRLREHPTTLLEQLRRGERGHYLRERKFRHSLEFMK